MALPPILSGRQDINWRYDEITGKFVFQEILGEVHEVVEFPELDGRRGFRLNERPVDDGSIRVYKGNVLGDKIPANLQSRVTSEPIGPQVNITPSTMKVVVPSTVDLGSKYISAYNGVGGGKTVENDLYIQYVALNSKLSRDGTLPMEGNLNFNSHKAINVAPGTNSTDGINLSQLAALSNLLTNEVNTRTNADSTINSKLNPLLSLVKWTKFSLLERDYANDNESGTLGMESYAGQKGILIWYNARSRIGGIGAYGNSDSDFQVIDDQSAGQFNFRWTSPGNALMRWILIQWITDYIP
ncbi:MULTISPECIES: hypothetical protein [Leptospira]|uniref:hypothetical protein n=1 Tax=Leptospira TaxID=171 RepID=UPI0002929EFC|nr:MULTISPECIES: hypothetical protein [Leptospira]EKO77255.1 hypothetical protein LEP1GSC068_0519 [Leptospira sp. Fiocruz LV3954]EMI68007.1 hypothetical protein LEP1GSC076_0210 [Leptospira sp. Fiocruz LV4135]MDO6395760.1 hypothetical protein [Leptospira santarosai]